MKASKFTDARKAIIIRHGEDGKPIVEVYVQNLPTGLMPMSLMVRALMKLLANRP